MNDHEIYRRIAEELSNNTTEPGAWTRAFAEAGGSPEKTKAFYIQLRFATLKAETPDAPLEIAATPTPAPAPAVATSAELIRLRRELADKLAATGKASFYSFFGLSPMASDGEVTAAIARHETRIKEGLTGETPEFRYARDGLRPPFEREKYDRRLAENLAALETRRGAPHDTAPELAFDSGFMAWWASRKTTVLVGVAAIVVLGYLTLDFVKTNNAHANAKGELTIKGESARSGGEIERERVHNQRIAIEGGISTADKAIDHAAELQQRELSIRERAEDRQRLEMEYRAAQQQQLIDTRQSELARRSEDARAARERQYWACMKLMSNRVSGQCEHYRR